MRRGAAAAVSAVFFAVAPAMVAGVLPWWLTRWRPGEALLPGALGWLQRAGGIVLLAAGAGVLLHSFARFVVEGAGTPAPPAPTERLVVGGLYRHVRNPMYLGVVAAIVGQALLLGRLDLLELRRDRRGRLRGVRSPVRGADPDPAVRRRLRGVPAGGARLVAAASPLAPR